MATRKPPRLFLLDAHMETAPASYTSLLAVHGKMYASMTTSPPAAAALPQLCRALRLLITWPHRLYLDCVSQRDYSSSGLHRLYCTYAVHSDAPSRRSISPRSVGCTGSRRASGHCVLRRDYSSSGLHRLYCGYVVHPDAPSRRSTSRQSVALALVVRPVTASRGATTRRPDCTGSTAPMSCI
jgi:hypothetical protein